MPAPKTIAKLGSASYKGIRRVSKSAYEAGSSLLASPKKDALGISPRRVGGSKPVATATEVVDIATESLIDHSDEEEDVSDKDVVEDLLSAWTDLPS